MDLYIIALVMMTNGVKINNNNKKKTLKNK